MGHLGGRVPEDDQAPGGLRSRPAARPSGLQQGSPDGPITEANLLNLQRSAGNAAVTELVQRSPLEGVGGGAPLDTGVKSEMEARFGQSFSDVRVHTGGGADAAAKNYGATAYTVGSNMVFRSGAYNPSSGDGVELLAHELTHVVQQRSGPVSGTDIGGGVQVSDPQDSFEQEAAATAAAVTQDRAAGQ